MRVKESKTCPICCLDFQMAYGTGQKRWATQIYCGQKCYQLSRFGRPHPTSKALIPLEDRFWAKVDKDGAVHPLLGTKCWLWNGATHPAGYGLLGRGRNKEGLIRATHASWKLYTGQDVPKGMLIMHRCDNPPCCNPDHLELGTHKTNCDDMIKKGRKVLGTPKYGMDNNLTKISTETVQAIKDMWLDGLPTWGDGRVGHREKIMNKFSVSATTVKAIVAGKRRVNG